MTGIADLHVHTSATDGISAVPDVLEAASLAGLDVVAITDHNTIESALEAKALEHHYGVEVVVGEEISTRQGHVLALFIEKRIAPRQSLKATVDAIHAQDGLAIVAHPYDPIAFGVLNPWRSNTSTEELLALPFDGIEVLNACLVGIRPNHTARKLAERTTWARVAGSDAHSAATVATACTLFPGRTAADLRRAILTAETAPYGRGWSLRQYVGLLGKRELKYAGLAASYAAGIVGSTAVTAAVGLRSGLARIF